MRQPIRVARNPLRSCSAIVLAILALTAPSAAAENLEVQRPNEEIFLALRGKRGFDVYAALYPYLNVAVFLTQKGEGELRKGRWSGVAYAVHTPPQALRNGVDVQFGNLGKISGRFVAGESSRVGHHSPACSGPEPVSEAGRFVGQISFRGAGGYLTVNASHAEEFIRRSFKLSCKQGHANNPKKPQPGLFGFIEPPTRTYSSNDATRLSSQSRSRSRVTEFVALHHRSEATSTFKAATLEWLPGDVATTRWVEVSRVQMSSFTTGEPELRPGSAAVTPPPPFAGEATYSRATHSLSGDLSVSLPGLEVRLATKSFKAGLCVFDKRTLRRTCR